MWQPLICKPYFYQRFCTYKNFRKARSKKLQFAKLLRELLLLLLLIFSDRFQCIYYWRHHHNCFGFMMLIHQLLVQQADGYQSLFRFFIYPFFSISVHQCSLNHVFWCLVYANLGTCSYFCAKALETHQFKFSSTQSVWMSFVKDTVNYFIKFLDFFLAAVLITFFWKTLHSPYSLCNVSTQWLIPLIEIRDFC